MKGYIQLVITGENLTMDELEEFSNLMNWALGIAGQGIKGRTISVGQISLREEQSNGG